MATNNANQPVDASQDAIAAITDKVRRSDDILRKQVQADIHHFSIAVKVDRTAWAAWLSEEFAKRGCTAMSKEVGTGTLYSHAKALAFDILYELGGYETPHLCIPHVLDSGEALNYWRAIAIAANSH
jgi:hypothetical protein